MEGTIGRRMDGLVDRYVLRTTPSDLIKIGAILLAALILRDQLDRPQVPEAFTKAFNNKP